MSDNNEKHVAQAINGAEEVVDTVDRPDEKPRLLVDKCNPDKTVALLRDILAEKADLYDRGVLVRLVFDQMQKGVVAQAMRPDSLVLLAHQVSRPFVLKEGTDGSLTEKNAPLPRQFAVMYLDWRGEWNLAPLNGIASSPLLSEDGADVLLR